MKSFDNVLEVYDFSDDDIWDNDEDEIFYSQEESSESFIKSKKNQIILSNL